jgi:hypothetical protein
MIIISAGMQKSGSAYVYNIINDLLVHAGHGDAREIKEKHKLEKVLQWHNNNVSDLENSLLYKLARITMRDKNFAIKTHSGPTRLLKIFLKMGLAKVIYVYRDPRDVLLSAIDHGKKIIAAGENHTFAQMVDFDKAISNVKEWIAIREDYAAMKNVLSIRYEDIMQNPLGITKNICKYLGLNVPDKDIEAILFKYDKNNKNADMRGLHFNKAKMERYKEEFTEEQTKKTSAELGASIVKMGYELS